jgi:hypothetical protein
VRHCKCRSARDLGLLLRLGIENLIPVISTLVQKPGSRYSQTLLFCFLGGFLKVSPFGKVKPFFLNEAKRKCNKPSKIYRNSYLH